MALFDTILVVSVKATSRAPRSSAPAPASASTLTLLCGLQSRVCLTAGHVAENHVAQLTFQSSGLGRGGAILRHYNSGVFEKRKLDALLSQNGAAVMVMRGVW